MTVNIDNCMGGTHGQVCSCDSCRAARNYEYSATCCPRKLTHGGGCICGVTVRADAAAGASQPGEGTTEDLGIAGLEAMIEIDHDERMKRRDESAAGASRERQSAECRLKLLREAERFYRNAGNEPAAIEAQRLAGDIEGLLAEVRGLEAERDELRFERDTWKLSAELVERLESKNQRQSAALPSPKPNHD